METALTFLVAVLVEHLCLAVLVAAADTILALAVLELAVAGAVVAIAMAVLAVQA
jgi:hypothetical protein